MATYISYKILLYCLYVTLAMIYVICNTLHVPFVSFLSAGDSLISFDDDQATPSQAPSVNAMTSQMQAMSE